MITILILLLFISIFTSRFTEKEIKRLVDICKDTPGLCTNGKCVNTDDGGYICECNEGFMNVAVEGGYRCQGRSFLNCFL